MSPRGLVVLGLLALLGSHCAPERFVFDQDSSASTFLPASSLCAGDAGGCPLSTLHCDPLSGQCVACVEDTDCTSAAMPRCDFALHQCVQCGSNLDCSPGQACDPLSRQCIAVCPDGGGCPRDAPICSEQHLCTGCSLNADCVTDAGRRTCSPLTGKCVECSFDGQCSWPRPECYAPQGVCVECLNSWTCPNDRPVCDPGAHQCVAP